MRAWMPGILALLVLPLSGCIFVDVAPGTRRAPLAEETIEPAEGWFVFPKIALITLSGQISSGGGTNLLGERESSVIWIKDQLKKVSEDPRVQAVVLRIDSPGGDVTASDLIYRELQLFKQERQIPVLASIMDTGASGGYYVAMAADRVFVHPTSITGSIGVVAQLPNLERLGDKIGVEMRVIKSGDLKDLGSMWRDFAPGERAVLQEMIDQMYERFVGVVAENRPNLDIEAVRALADGRAFTAQQAVQAGLVDEILYLDEVIDLAKAQAGVRDASIVAYRRPDGYRGNIYAESDAVGTSASGATAALEALLGGLARDMAGPKLQYIWAP